MNYFKDNNNNIFAYDEEQVKQGFGSDLIEISESEKDLILAPSEQQLKQNRINEIYFELDSIDKKKVRAVTDALINNDLTRLNQLENEADLLRQELKSLQDGTV